MLKSFTLFSAILLLSAPALANNFTKSDSLYIGFNVGNSMFDVNDDISNEEFGESGFTLSDSDTGIQFYLGYQVNQYFGVEASYTDLGEASLAVEISESGVYFDAPLTISGSVENNIPATSKTLAVVGNYPINDDFFLKAKLGLNKWEISTVIITDYTIKIPELDIDESTYETEEVAAESGTDLFWSLGAEYVLDSFSITADYQLFSTDESEIALLSAGIKVSF